MVKAIYVQPVGQGLLRAQERGRRGSIGQGHRAKLWRPDMGQGLVGMGRGEGSGQSCRKGRNGQSKMARP